MKKYIATVANFFLPGLGYLIIGGSRRLLGIFWMLGFVGLTYVETSLQTPMPMQWKVMFGSIFLINTMFAIDVYREAKTQER